jgi:exopolysaccharide biosynthesis polyprenyl glycosylphosphotransferase
MDLINSLVKSRVIIFIKKWNLLNFVIGVLDILAITFAVQLAYLINIYNPYTGVLFFSEKRILLFYIGLLPFWLITLYLIQVTEIPRTKSIKVLFFEYFQSALIIAAILLIVYFVFKMEWISRLFLIELTFFGFIFLFLIRVVEYRSYRIYRAKGYNYVNVVLIADDSSMPFIESLIQNKEWGYRIIAIFTESALIKDKYEKTIILLPEQYMEVINDLMEVDIIDEVLYVKKKVVPREVRDVIGSCEELGVIFRMKYDENKMNLTNATKTKIGEEKFLNFINIPYNSYALAIKKIVDLNISLISIIILSPFLLAIVILIKLSSPGPVIFKQKRVGLRGRLFNLYKFRTMVADAEILKKNLSSANEMDGPVFKIKDDPRVTNIGKFLRKTGLDELPQLFNVLKGEMSLIGPRPPIPSETQQYERWQLRRLSVKPGLSCFWQIKPDRNNIKFEKWMEMDLAYIDNWSLRLDFLIMLKTIRTIFQRTGL